MSTNDKLQTKVPILPYRLTPVTEWCCVFTTSVVLILGRELRNFLALFVLVKVKLRSGRSGSL